MGGDEHRFKIFTDDHDVTVGFYRRVLHFCLTAGRCGEPDAYASLQRGSVRVGAAVVGVADPYGGETVKAFVSLRAGKNVTEAELIAFAKERMAAYKYPRQIEFLDEIPKTVTG